MRWTSIVLIVIGVVIVLSIIIKLVLHRKIRNIDGVVGLQNKDENIIGNEGDNRHEKP